MRKMKVKMYMKKNKMTKKKGMKLSTAIPTCQAVVKMRKEKRKKMRQRLKQAVKRILIMMMMMMMMLTTKYQPHQLGDQKEDVSQII